MWKQLLYKKFNLVFYVIKKIIIEIFNLILQFLILISYSTKYFLHFFL